MLHDNIPFHRDGLHRIGLTPPDTGSAIIPLMCRDEASTFTFTKRCLADTLIPASANTTASRWWPEMLTT